jgi:hypothetical protein
MSLLLGGILAIPNGSKYMKAVYFDLVLVLVMAQKYVKLL